MSVDPRSGRKWVTGLVIGLVVLIGVASMLATPYSRKPVDDYIDRVEASGKPVTLTAALGPDPPPEQNGVADVEAAGKWMDEHKGLPETWTVVGPWRDAPTHWWEAVTDERRRELDAFFADAKPFFDGVAAGLAKPRLRVPTPAGDRRRDSFDVMPRVRVVHVLAARALAATSAQDRLDAAELLAKLAVHAESHTVIDDYVSAMAMDDSTLAVRLSLAGGDIDAAVWRARLDGLLSEPWIPRLRDGIRRERAHLLELLRTADFSKSMFVSSPASPGKPWTALVERIAARVEAIRTGETIPENSPEDFVRLLASTERFETASTDSYPRLAAEIADVVASAPKGSAARSVASWLPEFAATLAKTDAASRLARIALAASEHRAKHGDFPASLDELKWAFADGVPLDPFTDAPFVYEKTATGLRIASVGRLVDHSSFDSETSPDLGLVWELKR